MPKAKAKKKAQPIRRKFAKVVEIPRSEVYLNLAVEQLTRIADALERLEIHEIDTSDELDGQEVEVEEEKPEEAFKEAE